MGRPEGWIKTRTGRPGMRSPGRPPLRREFERAFWLKIVEGMTSEDAARSVGVSGPVGSRWFRERGGMPSIQLTAVSGRYLSFAEREEIALLRVQQASVREIARRLGRSPSTVSRELRRNAATRSAQLIYRASVAQWKAELMGKRPKAAILVKNTRLREYVQERLSGVVLTSDGSALLGPETAKWKGRSKPRRQDRKWASVWSPEQISNRLRLDFPDDESMRISHEAIYQALYVESRGGLNRELVTSLRTGRSLRVPRARAKKRAGGHVTADVTIDKRPADVDGRATPGHIEGDLIIGTERSAIGTLVERKTRFTLLVHLPRLEGFGVVPRGKNGPALAGYNAKVTKDALVRKLGPLPPSMRRTLTWDRGKELAQHAQLTSEIGTTVFFADAHSPWQRATNENTNGLLRQFFPKGTDLARWSADDLDAVAATLNNRPRKCLGWKTPAEAWAEHLLSTKQTGVATTG